MRKAIVVNLDADILQRGTIIVNSRFLQEMIRKMPDGLVTITSDNNNVKAVCGENEFNFISIDIDEYPELPVVQDKTDIKIPQNILKSMINETLFAVAKDEVRPIYTGALFEISEKILTVVAIDGFRLARRCESIESTYTEDIEFIVPGFALSDVEKVCGETDDPIEISVGAKHISFVIDNKTIITRRLEGEFLNHKRSVPENFTRIFEIDRRELVSIVDRVSLVLTEKINNPVKMTFGENVIKFVCATPIGKAEDMCLCKGNGEDMEVGFNNRYLLEALKAASTDKIHLCLNTASSPCVIRDCDDSNKFTYLVLPIRMHS